MTYLDAAYTILKAAGQPCYGDIAEPASGTSASGSPWGGDVNGIRYGLRYPDLLLPLQERRSMFDQEGSP